MIRQNAKNQLSPKAIKGRFATPPLGKSEAQQGTINMSAPKTSLDRANEFMDAIGQPAHSKGNVVDLQTEFEQMLRSRGEDPSSDLPIGVIARGSGFQFDLKVANLPAIRAQLDNPAIAQNFRFMNSSEKSVRANAAFLPVALDHDGDLIRMTILQVDHTLDDTKPELALSLNGVDLDFTVPSGDILNGQFNLAFAVCEIDAISVLQLDAGHIAIRLYSPTDG